MNNGCRSLTDVEIEKVLSHLPQLRDQVLFLVGLKTGFRISELLSLTVGAVLDHGKVTPTLRVEKKKMKGKTRGRAIPISSSTQALIQRYIDTHNLRPEHFLFSHHHNKFRPLSRIRAWEVLKEAYTLCGLTGKLATHSMRKTFAAKVYEGVGKDIYKLKEALGHASLSSTASYLSVNQAELEAVILAL